MAFIIKDRVKENTVTTGTGAVSLGGSAATFDPFQSYMVDGDTTYYAIVHTTSGTDEWEVGIGTWNTGNTLTRTTVLSGSNGTSAVDFSAGTKDVFMTYPASKAVYTDASGDIDINGGTIDGTTIGATTADTGKFTTLQATGNVDFDGYIDMAAIDHPTHAEGRVYYDVNHKTLSYQSDVTDVEHELGIEEHVRVYNNTGSTIAKGKPVYWSGNQNDVPTIALGNATEESKYNVQGLTAGDIAANSYGYVIVSGLVDGIDTSGLTAGQNVFMGLADGQLQNASPTYPNYPMCIGWVVKSDATDGIILVNQQNHSVNSFRVRTSAHIGDDLIVGGDLTVLGSQTIASSENVSIANAWNYFNSGDTIGALNTNFSGTGLNDASLTGHFTGPVSTTYYVRIDGVGTGTGGVDTFEWSTDNFATTVATDVDITGEDQLIHSTDNIAIKFEATTGHTLGDTWTGTAAPLAVDTGFATNRNTGSSGVGYTHMGIYYDVSTDKWTVFDEYDPEPEGTIDTSHASFNYGTLKAGTFEGALTGNVTGNLTGTATSANALATARTIGGVSFDGSANINLPGVNTTGNQDTTGNADTATALETARTIQLTGDVTGSTSFDGSGNVSINATVQDDSHSHVISNVDGLQTALDGKTATTRVIGSGNGLTGGGNLTANRTLSVGAGSGITVTADAVSHADTSSQGSSNNSGRTYIQDVTLDTFGHVTGLATATETVTDTTYSAGSGLSLSGTTFSHSDTSSQGSVNNSSGTVIQDITLDTYGHITGINSTNLDGRYYTETEADSRFVNVTGDTMTGALTMQSRVYSTGGSTSTGVIETDDTDQWWIKLQDYDLGIYWNTTNNHIEIKNAYGDLKYNTYKVFHDGYHPNADKWTTARTLTLSGDVTGSVSWDGSTNATLSTTMQDVFKAGAEIPSGANLNSYRTTGYYSQNSNSDASSGSNYPVDLAGMLEVITDDTGNGLHTVQRYTRYNSNNDTFKRYYYNGSWSAWEQNFDGTYHPNADKWTTARTLSLSGDASGSVSWDGSANATLSVTVNNDSHDHHWINSDSPSDGPDNALQYLNTNGTTTDSPTTDWYNTIRMGHGDPNSYYNNTLAMKMTGSNVGALYGRTRTNGTAGSWNRFFADNYHPNADKWTTARTLSLSGDASGSVSWDGSSNATLSVTVNNDSHTHSWSNITGKDSTILLRGGDIGGQNWNNYIDGTEASWNTVLNASGSNRPPSYTYGTALSFSKSGQGKFQLYANEQASGGGTANGGLVYRTGWNTSYRAWRKIWDDGNDGSGSGLDADLLDGQHASAFQPADNALTWVDSATGNYGTIKVDDDRGVSFAGYAIRDDWVFMSNGSEVAGVYNDTDNEWAIKYRRNAEVELFHNGLTSLVTVGSNGIRVGSTSSSDIYMQDTDNGERRIHCNSNRIGFLNSSNAWGAYCDDAGNWFSDHSVRAPNFYVQSAIYHNGDTDTYTQFHAADQWRVVTGGAERLEVNNSQITSTEPIVAPSFSGNGASVTNVNASSLNGRNWSTSRNSANTLVTRDGNGYTQLGWIDTTSGATTATVNRIYASNDSFIRYVTPATLKSQLGAVSLGAVAYTAYGAERGYGAWNFINPASTPGNGALGSAIYQAPAVPSNAIMQDLQFSSRVVNNPADQTDYVYWQVRKSYRTVS